MMTLTQEQKEWIRKQGINPAQFTREQNCPKCGVCAGSDHHWLYDGKKMVCKHCGKKRPVSERDSET